MSQNMENSDSEQNDSSSTPSFSIMVTPPPKPRPTTTSVHHGHFLSAERKRHSKELSPSSRNIVLPSRVGELLEMRKRLKHKQAAFKELDRKVKECLTAKQTLANKLAARQDMSRNALERLKLTFERNAENSAAFEKAHRLDAKKQPLDREKSQLARLTRAETMLATHMASLKTDLKKCEAEKDSLDELFRGMSLSGPTK